jgi:hypothetical protein
MALTALQAERLKKLGLEEFLETNKKHYKGMAKDAYEYSAKTLKGTNQPVRQEDVSGHLEAAVELDAKLTDFLDGKHQTQQYWPKLFTYRIVETVWKEIEDEFAKERRKG